MQVWELLIAFPDEIEYLTTYVAAINKTAASSNIYTKEQLYLPSNACMYGLDIFLYARKCERPFSRENELLYLSPGPWPEQIL